MITYRLADSVPQEMLRTAGSTGGLPGRTGGLPGNPISKYPLAGSAGGSPAEKAEKTKKRKLIEVFLDKGYGSSILKNPEVARIIIENWLRFDG